MIQAADGVRGAFVVVWALTWLLGPAARAEAPPVARLELTRGPGTEVCPDATALAGRVAALLGRPAFVETAPLVLEVGLTRRAGRYRARVVAREGGLARGARELAAAGPGCEALAETLALTLALVVDPVGLDQPSPAPRRLADEGERRARAEPLPSPPPRLAARPSPTPRTAWDVVARVATTWGRAPGVGVGPELGVQWTLGPVRLTTLGVTSFGASGAGSEAIATSAFGGRVELGLAFGDGHGRWGAQVGIEALSWRVDGVSTGGARPHLGALLGVSVALSQHTALTAQVAVPWTQQRLTRDGVTTWETPSVYGLAALELRFGAEP